MSVSYSYALELPESDDLILPKERSLTRESLERDTNCPYFNLYDFIDSNQVEGTVLSWRVMRQRNNKYVPMELSGTWFVFY